MVKFCPTCGKSVQFENAEICPSCGVRIQNPTQIKTEVRNPWIAVILSFLFVGWGQWYNGKTWDGLKFLGAVIVTYVLIFVFTVISASLNFPMGIVLVFILYIVIIGIAIYGMYDAYTTAEKINRGEESFSGKSGLFWLPVVLLVLGVLLIFAAIIAAFVFGMAGNIQSSKTVGITLTQNAAGYGVATIMGGTDLKTLNQVNVNIDGGTEAVLIPQGSIAVGKSATTANTVAGKRVILIGYFNDGSKQILVDKQF